MATYLILANFTEQGIKNVKESPKRAQAMQDLAKKVGATVKATFWTLGQFDAVAIIDAPDEASVTAFGLALGMLGNVRTQTLRAFTSEEMTKVLGKMT